MDPDFEQQLQARLVANPDMHPADAFTAGVRQRIRRIRRGRRVARAIIAIVLVLVVLAVTPTVVTIGGLVAESAATLSTGIGQLISSPLAFVVGIVIAVVALLDQRAT